MLAPQSAEHAEFNLVRFTAQPLNDEIILIPAEGYDIESALVDRHASSINGRAYRRKLVQAKRWVLIR